MAGISSSIKIRILVNKKDRRERGRIFHSPRMVLKYKIHRRDVQREINIKASNGQTSGTGVWVAAQQDTSVFFLAARAQTLNLTTPKYHALHRPLSSKPLLEQLRRRPAVGCTYSGVGEKQHVSNPVFLTHIQYSHSHSLGTNKVLFFVWIHSGFHVHAGIRSERTPL